MAKRDDEPWRLPATLHGKDARLAGAAGPDALPPRTKERLRRIAAKAPEAMVKLTGRARGGAAALREHLAYITRQGLLPAETQDGERIAGQGRLEALREEWLLANAAAARNPTDSAAAQSVAFILSMPPGTPPGPVEDAGRAWARSTFAGRHDWLMVRHDDTGHPHVHVTVRAVGYDGRRLAPGREELQLWRERFADELRRRGIDAEATPRLARGQVRKASPLPTRKAEQRGEESHADRAIRQAAAADAGGVAPPEPAAWSQALQAQHAAVRAAYLRHAEVLEQGDAADRRLAGALHRFVADLPVPLTRRQALAAVLRAERERQPPGENGRPVLPSRGPDGQSREAQAILEPLAPVVTLQPPRPRGRS
ncbi:relaxase/mobilization nuclease domain-containing protein [Azospirillum sp. TSA2s]|uniref:relaxase/mobilization nuclease domain-containing protein n=1 Tax=Azospirillum sp. TSA2s TaxID=709810 RepID=UPI00145B0C4C|nr:relaxase/mobilization nuclease domain-containing protein [Azospirillum sp. TSA2s]